MPDEKPERGAPDEPLLARWSRLKKEAAAQPQSPPAGQPAPKAEAEPVALPPVESLTPESDFSPFMQRDVRPELRQAALKKLFTDPHFNVMDGLDIYIDDYTKPDPIAASIVAELTQFRNLDGLPRAASADEMPPVAESADEVCATATETLPDGPGSASCEDLDAVAGDSRNSPGPCDTKSHEPRQTAQIVPPESA
jgi:hypothetical protein